MSKDPAPFVMRKKYAGDKDLIYTLGVRFYAIRVSAPAIPELECYMDRHRYLPDAIPWQHTRLTFQFTYQKTRQPMIQMMPIEATGVMADFIREELAARGELDSIQKDSKIELPASFSVIVDTNGPEKVGGLSRDDAAKFLREQLQSKDPDVIEAAYEALAKLMDLKTVQIATSMLGYSDIRLRGHAAAFLASARDQDSLDEIMRNVEVLPQRRGYDQDMDRFIDGLGKAVLRFKDPKTAQVLKRVIYKGYSGGWFATALAQMGDESAFEPLLYHIRNPYVDHYPQDLTTLIKRSNLTIEPWMSEGISSDDSAGKQRQADQWIAWWDAHKADFRIIRSWEEANLQSNR